MTRPRSTRGPRNDAEWARSAEQRLRTLEQPTAARVGEFVITDVDGALTVVKPGQEPFEIQPVSTSGPETAVGGVGGSGEVVAPATSAARIYRASSTAVVLEDASGSEQVLPDNTFDTLDYVSSDLSVDLVTGSISVTKAAVYVITFRGQAANVFKSTTASGSRHTVTPLLYVSDEMKEYGEPASSAMDGLSNPLGSTALASRWVRRLIAGATIQVGHRNDRLMDSSATYHRLIGDAVGSMTFLSITPVG